MVSLVAQGVMALAPRWHQAAAAAAAELLHLSRGAQAEMVAGPAAEVAAAEDRHTQLQALAARGVTAVPGHVS